MPNYKKHFLTQVIIRMDFPASINGLARTLPKEIKDAAIELFPIPEPKKFIAKELQISKQPTKEESKEGTDWVFHSNDKGKTLIVAQDNLNITYRTYESFEILKNDFTRMAEAMFKAYPELQISRLGLRYINEIKLPANNVFDWHEYLDDNLLALFTVPKETSKIARAFNNLVLNHEGIMLRLQYGMFNPDFPALIRKKIFILDYDAYYNGPQDFEEIKSRIDIFHGLIEASFEQSIKNKLRDLMEPISNG
jgi:uncharacterized protein (TIGR04255 family)